MMMKTSFLQIVLRRVLLASFATFVILPQQAFTAPAENSAPPVYSSNPVVATVEGESLYLDDLKNAQMHESMARLHQIQLHELKKKILQKLGKKHPDFLDQNFPTVSQSQITRFYSTTPGVKEMGSLEQMQGEIRDYLEKTFRENYVEQKYAQAIKNGWVQVFLTPPNEFRLVASVGSAMRWFNDSTAKSKKKRKVFLLEYSDFQCPFCKLVQKTLDKLRIKYSQDVQFGFRHFPLPFHKEAQTLAEAVECARDQNRFWPLLSIFFRDYSDSSVVTHSKVIRSARIAQVKNLKAFQDCWEEGKYSAKVMNDIREGSQLGIQGTPTFILGLYDPAADTVTGEMFSGAVSEEQFVRKIEKYLALSRPEAKLAQ